MDEPRRIFVLYPNLVGDPAISWLEEMRDCRLIKSYAVFPPRTRLLTNEEMSDAVPPEYYVDHLAFLEQDKEDNKGK
jgi:hypothetical protein